MSSPIRTPSRRLSLNAHGKGGYHTVGLYLDTCSQHVWGDKFKTAGTGKTTIKSLTNIYENFALAETFMSDGGRHFDNTEVDEFCKKWGGKHHVVAAYSPWINGLVEGTNNLVVCTGTSMCP